MEKVATKVIREFDTLNSVLSLRSPVGSTSSFAFLSFITHRILTSSPPVSRAEGCKRAHARYLRIRGRFVALSFSWHML